MTTTTPPAAVRRPRPQGGPPLLAPALAYGALMVTAVVLSAGVPQPTATAAAVAAYGGSHHAVLEVAGCLGFAASAPLAIWAATGYRRVLTLGVTAPGAVIALAGGLLAAIGVLSTFALLTPVLDVTLPVGRFGGLLWLIAASIVLPRSRRAARTHPPGPSPVQAGQPAETS